MTPAERSATYARAIERWEEAVDCLEWMVDQICPEVGPSDAQVQALEGFVQRFESLVSNTAVKQGLVEQMKKFRSGRRWKQREIAKREAQRSAASEKERP